MCRWGDTVPVKVKIVAVADISGRLVPLAEPLWEVRHIDRCMAPIVEGLQNAGVWTMGCCCGHGRDVPTVLLADGRTLYICEPKPWECRKMVWLAIKRCFMEFRFRLRICWARIKEEATNA